MKVTLSKSMSEVFNDDMNPFRKIDPQLEIISTTAHQLLLKLTEGPFLAIGKFGPSHYKQEPKKLADDSFGWAPGSDRVEGVEDSAAWVCGIRIENSNEKNERTWIYFTLPNKVEDTEFYQLKEPVKVYAISHRNFMNSMNTCHKIEDIQQWVQKEAAKLVDEEYKKMKAELYPLRRKTPSFREGM